MKKIIPSKVLLLFIAFFIFIIPILGYLLFSLVAFLVLHISVPFWCFYLGLITSMIILIFVLCSNDQYGIVLKDDRILYSDYSIKPICDAWELDYNEISRIEYKKRGDVFESKKEFTGKNIIILFIDEYRFKCIDLALYSNCQSKKIYKKIQNKLKDT